MDTMEAQSTDTRLPYGKLLKNYTGLGTRYTATPTGFAFGVWYQPGYATRLRGIFVFIAGE